MSTASFFSMIGAGTTRLLFILTTATSLLACGNTRSIDASDTAYLEARTGVNLIAACRFDRILIGPGGESATVWKDEQIGPTDPRPYGGITDNIQIIASERGNKRTEADVLTITAPGRRLVPVSYSHDGRHLWFLHGHRLVSANIVAGTLRRSLELGKAWSNVRVTTASEGDPTDALIKSSSSLQEVGKGQRYLSAFATFDHGRFNMGYVPAFGDFAQLMVRGTLVQTHLPAQMLRKPYVLNIGPVPVVYSLGRSSSGPPEQDTRYRKPIIDVSTASWAGTFTPIQVELQSGADRIVNDLVVTIGRGSPIYIRDVSVSGDQVGVLVSTLSGEVWVGIQSGKNRVAQRICGDVNARPTRDAGIKLSDNQSILKTSPTVAEMVTFDPIQKKSHSFGFLVRSNRNSRKLLVFMNGGPGASALDGDIYSISQKLAGIQTDILSFEYSGSAAGVVNLLQALKTRGLKSIENDSTALADWIARSGYTQVHLVAGSFGSVPALAFMQRKRQRICSSTLAAPLLKYRRPDTILGTNTKSGRDVSFWREAFERVVIGDEQRINELSEWLRRHGELAKDNRSRIYFAAVDPISKPSDLVDGYPADLVSVEPGNHDSILQSPRLWARVRELVLAKNCG